MTVYELIQELAQYDPDMEVKIVLNGTFKGYVDIPEEDEIDEDRNMRLPIEIDEEFEDYSLRRYHQTDCVKSYIKLEVEPS